MFEAAEVGRKLDKSTYEELIPSLRVDLLDLQQRLRGARFPVVLVFAGVDAAGKRETVNRLNQWMDPRFLHTRAYASPSDEERERPEMWRYWAALPPKGRIGIFQSSWYSRPLLDRVAGGEAGDLDQALDRIATFEQLLADDGALILKFWMHMSREDQRRRLKELEQDPLESWRVSEESWKNWRRYDAFLEAAERTITRTSAGRAPWHLIEGVDDRYRSVAVATRIRDALRSRLDAPPPAMAPAPAAPFVPPGALPNVLGRLDLQRRTPKEQARDALRSEVARLARLQHQARQVGLSTVVVFEGWDAAGKGGAIKRIAEAWPAAEVRMHPIAAPTDDERAHHYLWRFWTRLPRAGHVAVFDRSWYGRVLVERVEGLAAEPDWRRAYAEIRHFEEQLVDHGTALVKVWLHLSPDEQLRRFEERARTAYKAWKLTAEDWRNRERWADYEAAVHDLVERTSTRRAPWTLIPADDKGSARAEVARTVADAVEAALQARLKNRKGLK